MKSKKSKKTQVAIIKAGDPMGAQFFSWSFFKMDVSGFNVIYKSIDERLMWQDPLLTQ
jgi:hypothetical protein